jgi:hypothetical protein
VSPDKLQKSDDYALLKNSPPKRMLYAVKAIMSTPPPRSRSQGAFFSRL